jgi:hypothetical protein
LNWLGVAGTAACAQCIIATWMPRCAFPNPRRKHASRNRSDHPSPTKVMLSFIIPKPCCRQDLCPAVPAPGPLLETRIVPNSCRRCDKLCGIRETQRNAASSEFGDEHRLVEALARTPGLSGTAIERHVPVNTNRRSSPSRSMIPLVRSRFLRRQNERIEPTVNVVPPRRRAREPTRGRCRHRAQAYCRRAAPDRASRHS